MKNREESTMKRLLLLGVLVAVAVCFVWGCVRVLDAVGKTCSFLFIGKEDEVQLGRRYYDEIVGRTDEYPVLDSVVYDDFYDYFRDIGDRLAASQTDRPEDGILEYVFTIIDDTTINAFAVPGGFIFVYTGLIKKCANEAQLAGVMAHELGHITKKHGVDAMCSSGLIDYSINVLLGDSSVIGQAVDGLLFMNGISQPNEYEADSCAVAYMAEAGYNPYGMRDFLDTLRDMGDVWFEPLSTHPETAKRIAAVEKQIGTMSNAYTTEEYFYERRYKEMVAALQ
ncbi:MAG: M48 family metalloprotease [Chitinivibrionales bacterium]|nr:M48 family metalloprotease [Chitinivibrionales bacterium]MBD3357709.1 M48 family metalloprotease [Chitinivibrionales bacterium]